MSGFAQHLHAPRRSRLPDARRALAPLLWSVLGTTLLIAGIVSGGLGSAALWVFVGRAPGYFLWTAIAGSALGGALGGFGLALRSELPQTRSQLLLHWFQATCMCLSLSAFWRDGLAAWSLVGCGSLMVFSFIGGRKLMEVMGWRESPREGWHPRTVREMRADALHPCAPEAPDRHVDQNENSA